MEEKPEHNDRQDAGQDQDHDNAAQRKGLVLTRVGEAEHEAAAQRHQIGHQIDIAISVDYVGVEQAEEEQEQGHVDPLVEVVLPVAAPVAEEVAEAVAHDAGDGRGGFKGGVVVEHIVAEDAGDAGDDGQHEAPLEADDPG